MENKIRQEIMFVTWTSEFIEGKLFYNFLASAGRNTNYVCVTILIQDRENKLVLARSSTRAYVDFRIQEEGQDLDRQFLDAPE